MFATRFISRIDAHDRGLLLRWSLDDASHRLVKATWIAVTTLGSAGVTIGSVAVPLALVPWPRAISKEAGAALALSHLMVQLVKRFAHRPRPALPAVIAFPDRYSFPSGHATASLAVALAYGLAFPAVAVPLVTLGLLVGWSRVVLGVHYPGDVLVGQLIATGTVLALHAPA